MAEKQQTFISHGAGGWESKIRALGDLVSGEDLLPGSLEVPSCYVLTQKRGLYMFVSLKVLTVCDTKTLVSVF